MTPFASGALSRGLTALLVSCVRLQGTEFNANKQASRIDRNHPYVKEAIKTICGGPNWSARATTSSSRT